VRPPSAARKKFPCCGQPPEVPWGGEKLVLRARHRPEGTRGRARTLKATARRRRRGRSCTAVPHGHRAVSAADKGWTEVVWRRRRGRSRCEQSSAQESPKDVTPSKRRELKRKIRLGEAAQQTFVQSNLRLVVSIAKKDQASGLPLRWTSSRRGTSGLMHAVEKFDWPQGLQVSPIATWWIRQAITRGIPPIRSYHPPPRDMPATPWPESRKAQARLELSTDAPPPWPELGAESRCRRTQLIEALRFRGRAAVRVGPLRGRTETPSSGDVVEDRSAEFPPFEVAATSFAPPMRSTASCRLSTNAEREILRLRFGLDRGEPRTPSRGRGALQPGPGSDRQIEAPGHVRKSCATRRRTPGAGISSPSDPSPEKNYTGHPPPLGVWWVAAAENGVGSGV